MAELSPPTAIALDRGAQKGGVSRGGSESSGCRSRRSARRCAIDARSLERAARSSRHGRRTVALTDVGRMVCGMPGARIFSVGREADGWSIRGARPVGRPAAAHGRRRGRRPEAHRLSGGCFVRRDAQRRADSSDRLSCGQCGAARWRSWRRTRSTSVQSPTRPRRLHVRVKVCSTTCSAKSPMAFFAPPRLAAPRVRTIPTCLLASSPVLPCRRRNARPCAGASTQMVRANGHSPQRVVGEFEDSALMA